MKINFIISKIKEKLEKLRGKKSLKVQKQLKPWIIKSVASATMITVLAGCGHKQLGIDEQSALVNLAVTGMDIGKSVDSIDANHEVTVDESIIQDINGVVISNTITNSIGDQEIVTGGAITDKDEISDSKFPIDDNKLSIEEQLAVLQSQYAEMQAKYDALMMQQNGYGSLVANDSFLPRDWKNFVEKCKNILSAKINNENEEGMKAAFILLNIDYLDENGKEILLNHYAQGQDVEIELNKLYAVLSQVREHNTEIKNADDYLSYTSMMLDEKDQTILSVLDGYAKEVITLRNDLTDANKARIQEIFDIVYHFSNGTGMIKVMVNGEEQEFAQIHLSHGGIFVAENIAQDISVLAKEVVPQAEREKLDEELRAKDTLAKTQEKMNLYMALASMNAKNINAEAQELVVEQYNQQLGVIAPELETFGVTKEETQSLFTIANIDYFMDSANSQHAFDVIYEDGFDINATFRNAEEAVRKIQAYNDTQEQAYDMARLVIENVPDAISLRAFTQTTQGINSQDSEVVAQTVHIVKGYTQFSKDATVDYQTMDEEGNVIEHSIDKNGIGKGAYQIINWYTYYSVSNHMEAYGKVADSLIQLVDGSELGLNPYEQIVLAVEDYCAENNIVVYDYQMGETLDSEENVKSR